jgi:hypothetical protein
MGTGTSVIRVCLRDFRANDTKLATSVNKIAEGLLELAGVSEILDTPYGKRIFTVERMPDNVPMAGMFWETYEPTLRDALAFEALRAGQIGFQDGRVRMEPAETAALHRCPDEVSTHPPDIIEWGESCDRCGWKAEKPGCGMCDGTGRTARYGRKEEGEPHIVRGDCPNCCPGSCKQAANEEWPE